MEGSWTNPATPPSSENSARAVRSDLQRTVHCIQTITERRSRGGAAGASRAEAAFTDLYRSHYAAIRSYANVCVPAAEVDDVVADTFLVAWRRIDDVPVEWARGWLIGVARNVVRSRHRRLQRANDFVAQLIDLRPDTSIFLDSESIAFEDLDALTRSFGKLSDSDQEILMLAGPYDLPMPEIALALDITPNNVGVRLHRARARLRAAFDAQLVESTFAEAAA